MDDLDRVTHLIAQNKKQEAWDTLQEILTVNPKNESAWLAVYQLAKQEVRQKVIQKALLFLPESKALKELLDHREAVSQQGSTATKEPIKQSQPVPKTAATGRRDIPLAPEKHKSLTTNHSVISLSCPNCGGSLEFPDSMSYGHCIYCGTKVALKETKSDVDEIGKLMRLADIAIEAKNYTDAVSHVDKVLSLQEDNVEAWVIKALATYHLSTFGKIRFEEAIKYLKRAYSINSENQRIHKAAERILEAHSGVLTYLGNQAYEKSIRLHNFRMEQLDPARARAEASGELLKAMDYLTQATYWFPGNISALAKIAEIHTEAKWMTWDSKVQKHIDQFSNILRKEGAPPYILQFSKKIREEKEKLKKLEAKGGLFANTRKERILGSIAEAEEMLRLWKGYEKYEIPDIPRIFD